MALKPKPLPKSQRRTTVEKTLANRRVEVSKQAKKVLAPSPALLCKLGSIVVHCDELTSPGGHEFDSMALQALLRDAEVMEWLAVMQSIAMVPVKRS